MHQGRRARRGRNILSRSITLLPPLLFAACSGSQSALDPAADKAFGIAWLFWFFTAVCVVVLLAVVAVMIAAVAKRRRTAGETAALDPARERRIGVAVAAATGTTVLILIVLTFVSYFATRGLGATSADPVRIRLTGKQWWWEIEYQDRTPSQTYTTANELHVPVGRPVTLILLATDVIHSFWVPNVAGKMDLIPGRTNTITFTLQKPGTYRGQCAEFCGLQHAHMALLLIADNPAEFDAWRAREHADAPTPDDPEQARGMEVFLRSGCVACHAIRGTPASGLLGPDLTHVGARSTLAAGTLPNTRGNLQGWIADPQGIKPGAQMPRLELAASDLNAVTAYLAGLK
jgi:cytochrome c oxidase subunit 2